MGYEKYDLTEEDKIMLRPRKFNLEMTKGAQVVCLGGVHDKQRLLSLYSYYN